VEIVSKYNQRKNFGWGKHDNESLKEALIESFIEWDILLK